MIEYDSSGKKCSKCGLIKSVDEFHRNKTKRKIKWQRTANS
jgi:hypothetical protein